MSVSRIWHAATAFVVLAAVVLQLCLVVDGAAVLDDAAPPSLALRLARFIAYFTIQSNILVLVTTIPLLRDPTYDGPLWRVARAAALVGIAVTGVVHFVLLRPLLDLSGWSFVADKLLHIVVPTVALVGWLLFGPWHRFSRRVLAVTLLWPAGWLLCTLVVGAASGWFPYPFLDYEVHGWGEVLIAATAVTALFIALGLAVLWWDRRGGWRARPS